ncbi:class I SAM-dependent methyltransferase [Rhodococcus gannanensis]|uniref:Class I SAM-dependent methyltransferase n=1 Tax=Rhodococcus gannanensis TaxID=1960308 RepID=A0ABW4P8T4_9NOCA
MDVQEWDRRYREADAAPAAAPDPAVVEFVTALPAGRALDLGCGAGRHALWLALRAWQVTAVDFSTAALTAGVRNAHPLPRATRDRLTWVNADVTKIEFHPDYDLVLVCDLHLTPEERRGLLRRATGALRPGGTLIARTEDGPADDPAGHRTPCTPEELADDVRDLVTVVAARPTEAATPAAVASESLPSTTRASPSEALPGALIVGFRGSVGT